MKAALVSGACASLLACGGDDDDAPTAAPAAPEPTSLKARVACTTLTGQTIPSSAFGVPSGSASITSAELIAAAAPFNETFRGAERTAVAVPEYCKVVGQIAPVDPAAPSINYQVNLPTDRNLKAAQLGGSGFNGSILASPNTHFNAPETQPAGVGSPLVRGYIEMGSDSGHSNATPTWTLNNEAAENLGHLQLKKT